MVRAVPDILARIAEHKRAELARYKSGVELTMMRTLKQAFDPLNLMNPGKIL